jgi:2-iminobutanoate/2-iminopropanoate deaminase
VFSSTITGADPETGQLSSQPDVQAAAAFRNLEQLLDRAGLSLDEIGLLRIAIAPSSATYVDPSAFVGHKGPSTTTHYYPLPDGELVQLQVVGVRGGARQALVVPGTFPADQELVGVWIGDMLFSPSISGVDPETGELVEDRRGQVQQAFRNMEALVRQAGGSIDDVAHIFIYVRDLADNDDVLATFLEAFPTDGNRAVRKNVYDDQLHGTPTVALLQFVAVIGQGGRENYEVPGAAKKHPNPLGTRIGNLLFSAGIGGQDPVGREVERQAMRALSNLRALVEQAGGSLTDLAHVTFTVDDYAHAPIIEQEWRKLFPDPADEPARHIMAFGGREGSYQIQVHAIAVLGGER